MSSATPSIEGGRGFGRWQPALIAAAVIVVFLAVVAVAHAIRTSPHSSPAASSSMSMSSGTHSGYGNSSSTSSGMSGMSSGSSSVMTIHGATLPAVQTSGTAMPVAMAMVPLGQATWDGMDIAARATAPATFILLNGSSQQLVKPTANDSFHLMVMLTDAESGVAIPYSSVWATITKGSKVVFDERLWPMISRYMGPHYGNNVSLPSAGLYHVSLLVSPPAAARHLEYKGMWLKPGRVAFNFKWVPKT